MAGAAITPGLAELVADLDEWRAAGGQCDGSKMGVPLEYLLHLRRRLVEAEANLEASRREVAAAASTIAALEAERDRLARDRELLERDL